MILVEIEQCHLAALRDFARSLRELAVRAEHWGSAENLDATLDAVAEALDEASNDRLPTDENGTEQE